LDSFDQLRPHYRVEFNDAAAEAMPGRDVIPTLLDRAAVQGAFEAVGGSDACLHMARDYALERQIFGRPLAGYQAIKHKLADVAVAMELARSNAYFGGWAASSSPDDLPAAAACARLSAIKAFELAARENIQVHGGIGYTFEANCHFYYRRERLLAVHLGNRGHWADRLLSQQPGSQAKAAQGS
jgi:alkylation response protein AidB-like acyl-CoA dehydrogenase